MHNKTRTKREIFSDEMEVVAPWARLAALIDPSYTKPRKASRRRQLNCSFSLDQERNQQA